MNKVTLQGRITNDLEIKTTASGKEVCNFSVAVDRQFKDRDGNKQTDFLDCSVFSKGAAFVQKYFHKGDGIVIEGRLETRNWEDKEGKKRKSWTIICDHVEFPLGKGKGGNTESRVTDSVFSDLPDDSLTADGELPF